MGMSAEQCESLESVLEKFVPQPELAEVKRILYGKPVKELELSEATISRAGDEDYQVAGWRMSAEPEETRPAREVRIGLIQNKIILPTDAPIGQQVTALQKRTGANIICLQEAWTMPFAFCTREKHPWTQFAESAETGASSVFLAELAARHRLVIISPILERD